MVETKKLINYVIDIIEITQFKEYYHDNINRFSGTAKNSYLKALDIPPKFFKEQPEETQEELLDNREFFVAENKKYFDKVIVVVKTEFGDILNACRMDRKAAFLAFDKLEIIKDIPNKFEHRAFVKDGYTTIVISTGDIKKGEDNKVLVVDFPVLLNKTPIIHKATYRLPDETFATPVEHIQYLESYECPLIGAEAEFNNIKEAVEAYKDYLDMPLQEKEDKPILREVEIVSLALVEGNIIPKSGRDKVEFYINDHIEGELTTRKLENLVLDFDETFTGYKRVTNLRSINGLQVLEILESDSFKEFVEEMDKQLEEDGLLV